MKTVDGKPSGVWMDITRLYWFLLLVIRERKAERQRERATGWGVQYTI